MNNELYPLLEHQIESLPSLDDSSQLTSEQQQSWEEWVKTQTHDNTARFELIYNGKPIYLDLLTLLQCLKIAEHTHHVPPIAGEWWLKVVKEYPVEMHLDGRIQTQSK